MADERNYVMKESSASCDISQIKSIIYGGISSRFWMLRKHINSLKEGEEPPFYAWECLTLQLDTRDVDLVIKDEKSMTDFLRFLSYSIRSIDGI